MTQEAAAEILARQRLSHSPTALGPDQRPLVEKDAHALQTVANELLSVRLGAVAGHKIGCTTPVMQSFLGIASPCAGEVFSNTVLHGDGIVSRAGFRKVGV